MKTFVIGDIHARFEKLEALLTRTAFKFSTDRLVVIGDVLDSGPEPFECAKMLTDITFLRVLIGDYDLDFISYALRNESNAYVMTKISNTRAIWDNMSKAEKDFYSGSFLSTMRPYYMVDKNLYVHGGIQLNGPVQHQPLYSICRDTKMWDNVMNMKNDFKVSSIFDNIFRGHTPTTLYGSNKPMYKNGVWNVNTSRALDDPLTMMDVETKEYWQA